MPTLRMKPLFPTRSVLLKRASERERERERQTGRQTDRDRDRDRERNTMGAGKSEFPSAIWEMWASVCS